jgi:single-strand DNA-binding protein
MKQLTIIGNLGYDATVKEINGNKFLEFSVAVNERFKKQDGTQVETTDWVSCTYRNIAVGQYLKKGDRILVQGNMKVAVYQAKDKSWRAGINLNVFNIQFLTSKKDESETPAEAGEQQQLNSSAAAATDDLPF